MCLIIDKNFREWYNSCIEKALTYNVYEVFEELEMEWLVPLNPSEKINALIEYLRCVSILMDEMTEEKRIELDNKGFYFHGDLQLVMEDIEAGYILAPTTNIELYSLTEQIQPPRIFFYSSFNRGWSAGECEFDYKKIDFVKSELLKNLSVTFVQRLELYRHRPVNSLFMYCIFENIEKTQFTSIEVTKGVIGAYQDIVGDIRRWASNFSISQPTRAYYEIAKDCLVSSENEIEAKLTNFIELLYNDVELYPPNVKPFYLEIEFSNTIHNKRISPGIRFNKFDFRDISKNITCISIKFFNDYGRFVDTFEKYTIPTGFLFASIPNIRGTVVYEKEQDCDVGYLFFIRIYKKGDSMN